MSDPSGSGDILIFPVVRQPVRPSDCPSQNLMNATPLQVFCQGLKMCMTFDCNPQFIVLPLHQFASNPNCL